MEHGNEIEEGTRTGPPERLATVDTKMPEPELDPPVHAEQSFSSLYAEQASALPSEQETRVPNESPSPVDGQQKGSENQNQRSSSEESDPPPKSPSPEATPQILDDCTLNRSATATSETADKDQCKPSRFTERPGSSSPGLQYATGRHVRWRSQSRAHVQSPLGRTPYTSIDIQRPGSSLTVHDLGADYTRYYDPFADSLRTSFSRPSSRLSCSHAPATATSTATGLAEPLLTSSVSTTELLEDADPGETIYFIDDRLGAPLEEKDGLAWPLWGDEPEDDDAMHLPHPDDDKIFKIDWKDRFSKENIVPTIGVILMLIGLFIIFVGLPILTYTGIINFTSGYETPLSELPSFYPDAEDWAWVNDNKYPLFTRLRNGLIDPDTPDHAMRQTGEFGDDYLLVFSDEFNDNNRTFYEGDDPYFYAPDLWYGATQDLEWYDPDAVTTWDGVLELRLDKFRNHGLQFRSGMLNSWNQLCFKGGIFEVSMSLPGPVGVHGLWPGVWTLGNLGRPGYSATTEGTWPYTYQACDVGITPNQSSSDGISWLPGQRLPSCTCAGEDHPSPGTGRGAPEIDIAEMSVSYDAKKLPVATQSYQVAPFDIWYYPDYEFTAFPNQHLSYTNTYTGGPFQQAISATTNLNRDWYDGKAYQKFSFEYVPGDKKGSHITWKVGGQTMFTMDGRALGSNGNIQARQISQEPMSLVLNLGISNSWTWINWAELVFPTVLRVDYIRWYQKKGEKSVTCDPPGFETTKYIKEHIHAYSNPNLTKWDQTGYGWPKHKLNSEC